jgi:hypothetical protein
MYLRQHRSPSNLGAFRRVAPVPVLPQLRRASVGRRLRGLRGLGDDPNSGVIVIDPSTGVGIPAALQDWGVPANMANPAQPLPLAPGYPAGQAPADVLAMPGQPQGPVMASVAINYTSQPVSGNPLDYASPQAAIAAGLNSQATMQAWTQLLSRYPTQQAAIAAGIPAGVVTQLWAASRAVVPGASWLDQTTFGIPNKFLVGGVAVVGALAAMGGRRR